MSYAYSNPRRRSRLKYELEDFLFSPDGYISPELVVRENPEVEKEKEKMTRFKAYKSEPEDSNIEYLLNEEIEKKEAELMNMEIEGMRINQQKEKLQKEIDTLRGFRKCGSPIHDYYDYY